jgi:Na+-driven multidrug efflux pump
LSDKYVRFSLFFPADRAFCLLQIGQVDLAAMNLSNAILFATLVLPIGFTNAVRVLAAQSYGAGQAKNVGLWVQVGLALSAILFLIPITLVWLFAGDIVCAMNLQSEELEYLEEPDGMLDLGIAAASALFDNVTASATATAASSLPPPSMTHSQMMLEHELCEKASTFGRVSLLWLWPLVIYNVLTCVLEALEIVWPASTLASTTSSSRGSSSGSSARRSRRRCRKFCNCCCWSA